jgi:iron complex outermembrane receptor protein
MKIRTRTAALLLGVSSFAASAAAAQTAGGASRSQTGNQIEEVVVTAQRREESLQRVPVAVTALPTQQLDEMRITNVGRLDAVAPSLQVNTQGIQSTPNIIIRGVASGTSNNAVDPKVGIYVDGVYVGRSVGSIFDLADIERIEVLRGPQGTLFGRNATSGAISIVTSKPTGEFGGHGLISGGSDDAFRAKLSLDLPRVGPFSVRLSYLHDQIGGYAKNLIGGRTIDLSLREPTFGVMRYEDELGKRVVNGGQVAVRGDFGDFTADYRFDYTDTRSTGTPMQSFGPPNDATGPIVSAILAFQPAFGGITNLTTGGPLDEVAAATSEEHTVVQGHSLTLSYWVSPSLTLKSITAFRELKQDPSIFDLGATGGLRFTAGQLGALLTGNITGAGGVLDPANAPGPNDSFFTLLTARSTSQKQFSEEVQAQYTSEHVDAIGGVFYFHENSPAVDVLGILQPVANGVVLPIPAFDAIFGSGLTATRAINDSIAVYGQVTYHLTDSFDITGGLRYTEDDRENIISAISGGQGGALGVGDYKVKYSKLNYTAIATWRPTALTTVYAKASSGYVAGGILSGIPYRPETLTSYELGLKTTMLDNRLRANLSGFFSDYKDLQTQVFENGVQAFNNAGKATIKGFEAELEAIPMTGVRLGANLGYTDFRYDTYISNGVDIAGIARPVYTARWTARLSASYDAPDLPVGGHPFGRVDASFKSKSYLVQTPTQPIGTTDPLDVTPAHWILNGRVGVADLPIGDNKVAISLYGENLLDKRVNPFGASVLQLASGYERGRTWGVEVGFNF